MPYAGIILRGSCRSMSPASLQSRSAREPLLASPAKKLLFLKQVTDRSLKPDVRSPARAWSPEGTSAGLRIKEVPRAFHAMGRTFRRKAQSETAGSFRAFPRNVSGSPMIFLTERQLTTHIFCVRNGELMYLFL